MDQRSFQAAAKSGNIDQLYELIHEDPYVLDKIDNVPFIDTPLHVAALAGTTEFAMEMMHLKPSFARKLNADGLTPLHLAVDHGHFWLALELVKVDPSLVRLKGRQGMTPLLLAVSKKKIDLISEFFLVCPKSIVDANVNGENALHIAVKNNEPREGVLIVLKVLMGWILRLCQKDAERTETRVMNCRDKDGNTPLHLAAYHNNHKAMRLMLKSSNVNVNIENKNGLTVLDVAVLLRREGNRWGSWCGVERVVKWHGGKRSASLVKSKTTSDILGSKLTWCESRRTRSIRSYSWISEERRNALLVVATLIITATYQTVLQPPGGVSDSGESSNATSNVTTSGEKAGSVVMDDGDFLWLWIWNSVGFTFATLLTVSLLVSGQESGFWYLPLFIPLLLAYDAAGQVISPNKTVNDKGNLVCFIILLIWVLLVWFWDRLQSKRAKARGPKSGLVWEGFTTLDQARGVTPSKKSVIM
ncbi:ankyrin repeat-containing protein BDA1 [Raphanus sativus]|uniref:Ankyrin repeat-containing protein BDA1 n=1 Tax=Raphanus sativus TaxID=3726 RepID=A0A6J0MR99_RAPSA|nr:ankyrin repeat-containing protein BDA1 [Raphanus sativus]